MIDIHDNCFSAFSDPLVPVRHCVITRDGEPIFVGLIRESIDVIAGDRLYLNPADFKRIGEWMRKKMH
jgi:hypothetical protein